MMITYLIQKYSGSYPYDEPFMDACQNSEEDKFLEKIVSILKDDRSKFNERVRVKESCWATLSIYKGGEWVEDFTKRIVVRTAEEIVKALEVALSAGNNKKVLRLISPEGQIGIDWDDEPEYICEEWEELVDKALDKLGV